MGHILAAQGEGNIIPGWLSGPLYTAVSGREAGGTRTERRNPGRRSSLLAPGIWWLQDYGQRQIQRAPFRV